MDLASGRRVAAFCVAGSLSCSSPVFAARPEILPDATFPSANDYFEPVLADPTELGYGGRYLLSVGGNRYGEVTIGDYVGLLRWGLRDGHVGVQWNIGGGANARFNLSTTRNQLDIVDFTASSPVDVHWAGGHTVRVAPRHTSSHVGDDYIRRVGVLPVKRSEDMVELLYSYALSPMYRLYAGGSFAVNTVHTSDRGGLQCGTELHSRYYGDRRLQLFLAQDLQSWERVGWNPSYTVRGGVRFSDVKRIAAARVFVEYFTGRLLYLQFYGLHESRWSAGLNFEIGNPTRR